MGILFAAFEAIAASWLTFATSDGLDYMQQSATSFAIFAALNAAIGALAAGLAFGVAGRVSARIQRPVAEIVARFATLALVLTVAAHEWGYFPNQAIEIRQSLAISVLLALAIAASLYERRAAQWLAGLASPWMAAALLGIVPWLAGHVFDEFSWSMKQACAALIVVGLGALLTWSRAKIASPGALSLPLVGALLAIALAGSLPKQATFDMPAPSKTTSASKGPNVILITLDTVRADHLSVYGYARETTPFLKEFAKDADVFENSFSSGDFTLSSHASLFTGNYAIQHGARPDPDRYATMPLSYDALTLTEILGKAGWNTLAVAANCVLLDPRFGMAQGFEHYDSRYRAIGFPKVPQWSFRSRLHDFLHTRLAPHEFDLVFRGAAEINEKVFAQLDQRASGRPFFLFVNYMDAHAPYRPPAPFDTLYDPKAKPMNMPQHRERRADLYSGKLQLDPAEREHYTALYDGGITYLDSQLRLFFEHLKQLGLYDDALIVITSDHGEAFGEHGSMEHGMSAYQEQVRVPLLIKRPHAREGKRIGALASGIDIVPTVLAESGLATMKELPGRALFFAQAAEERVVFSEHYPTLWHVTNNPKRAIHTTAAVWKNFVELRGDDGRTERFDLGADPREEHPLDSFPPEVPDLGLQLESWIAPRRLNTPRDRKRTIDALNMLGYGK